MAEPGVEVKEMISWSRADDGKLQIWPIACFWMTCKLRMISTFFNGGKGGNQKVNDIWDVNNYMKLKFNMYLLLEHKQTHSFMYSLSMAA